MHWITATGLNTVTLLFGLAAVLLLAAALGVVFTTRARRRRERQRAKGRKDPENALEGALARWIEDGRQLFNRWQEKVERFDELQSRLAAMTQEIDQLRQEGEALVLERNYLRSILARIDELIQRASEAGLGAAPSGRAAWYPARPMDAASARITEKLWQGTLPADDPAKFWGGKGSGLPCDGCDTVISSSEPEHEVEMPDGRILRLHVACSGLWRVLKQALPES
jgi:TolA-binding protein